MAYLDDLLVTGTSKQDLADILEGVLRRLREHDIRLKKNKCHFSLGEIRYLGWIVSATELKPIPEKSVSLVLRVYRHFVFSWGSGILLQAATTSSYDPGPNSRKGSGRYLFRGATVSPVHLWAQFYLSDT